jgi:hypothetical protein
MKSVHWKNFCKQSRTCLAALLGLLVLWQANSGLFHELDSVGSASVYGAAEITSVFGLSNKDSAGIRSSETDARLQAASAALPLHHDADHCPLCQAFHALRTLSPAPYILLPVLSDGVLSIRLPAAPQYLRIFIGHIAARAPPLLPVTVGQSC